MTTLYLASASPRRQALLKQIGLTFSIINTDIDETPYNNELPADYVQRLAIAKAKAAFTLLSDQQQQTACILAADTTVSINNKILGKPHSQQQAIAMLAELSNKTHKVFTAITLYYQNQFINQVITTEVTMRAISEEEAIAYWQTGEPNDKAGGYAIQGLAAMFIEKIQGDYYSVVGLPLFATTQLLKQVGIYPLNKE
ncbi:Maf family protein [Entomomonas asaccharolytica]|uniref:dTTP/UTP pyrophosphatase n=1 Tax=Entomomonas asaccharolytica TaxID=2785331 RepID=A0A974RXH5_9GAMM|nr:Maf family protein [Entomomonas asaccharolytica]QQP86238.1 septum formation inhibitor Maf [Entomomonas asaccharolytica]